VAGLEIVDGDVTGVAVGDGDSIRTLPRGRGLSVRRWSSDDLALSASRACLCSFALRSRSSAESSCEEGAADAGVVLGERCGVGVSNVRGLRIGCGVIVLAGVSRKLGVAVDMGERCGVGVSNVRGLRIGCGVMVLAGVSRKLGVAVDIGVAAMVAVAVAAGGSFSGVRWRTGVGMGD
jgi:hypothetical protein